MKYLYIALGSVFLGAGVVGLLIPVVPTTPFLLLAAWAFARSSPRLHAWLVHHRYFGPLIRGWHEHRVIPLYAKILAWIGMGGSVIYLNFFSTIRPFIVAIASVVLVICAVFIGLQPSRVGGGTEHVRGSSSQDDV